MPEDNTQLLTDAIGRNCGLVISLPSAGMLRHHKSRFLADDPAGFWIESIPSDARLIDELIQTGKPSGVSFKAGHTKVVFTAPLLRREQAYRVNAQTTVEAVLVSQPAELKTIQRRNNYRVIVTDGSELAVRVWRIGEHVYLKDRPMAVQEVPAKLRDLSTGGVGVNFLAKDDEPPRVSPEDRLRIQLTLSEGVQILVEGRMRYPTKPPKDAKVVRAGIQFKTLESDLEGRQTLAALTKIVGEMQRAEARRYRLGIA